MMKWTSRLVLVAMTLAVVGSVSHARNRAEPMLSKWEAHALHIIQSNAEAARQNAHIYQWQRVNLEVDRIEAAERLLHKTPKSDATKQKASQLQQTVRALLSARLSRNVEQITETTQRLSALTATLLK